MKQTLIICSLLILITACTSETNDIINEYTPEEAAYIEPVYEEAKTLDTSDICPLKGVLLRNEYILEVEPIYISASFVHSFQHNPLLRGMSFEYGSVVIYSIRYTSDEYEVMGYVVAPADFMEREYPVLIDGGSGSGGEGQEVGTIRPTDFIHFALRGYIVLVSHYRGVAGGTGIEQFGGDEINDVLRLIDISESFGFAQQSGVYMFGGSRGGMMAYIASRLDDRITAVAVYAGPSNAFDIFHERNFLQDTLIELIGGTPKELPEEFERRSAVMWANEIQSPILIGHGDEDIRVPVHHAINMAEVLERYGLPHRLIIYTNAGHSCIEPFLDFLEEMDEWFKMHPIGE